MKIAALALILLSMSGCAANSMTGRSQLILVSESAAITKSSKLYESMIDSYDKDSKVSSDVVVNERVQKITNRLVERAVLYRPDSQKWQWQVNVIESEDVNAFCMAGGKMAIYTGLLNKVNPTDDELAQVMGHEISHALANHTAEKMSADILTKIAVATVTVAVAASDRSGSAQQRSNNQHVVQNAAVLAGAAFVTLPNSRGAENEADKLGIELAAQAGYNPEAAVTLWQKMMAATGSKGKGDFFSTHPSPPNRIESLQALQEPMKKIYEARAPLYADYKPAYQYVRTAKDSAGFSSSNVRVVTEGSALAELPTVDSTQAMAFYSPDYESFKQGALELTCKTCSLKFYMNQSDLKKLHDKQDWRGLVQTVIKTGYEFDLSYYYLAAAAKGLGLVGPSKVYFRKAKELSESLEFTCSNAKMIKCNGIDVAAVANGALK
ncbi:MAG: M48 family metallopeptidase [Methylotenera sp.]|nr:M48 family metallopeptidase [Methylotenera sp.]